MKKLLSMLMCFLLFSHIACAQKKQKKTSEEKSVKCKLITIDHQKDSTKFLSVPVPVSFTVEAEKEHFKLPLTIQGYKALSAESFNYQKLAVSGFTMVLSNTFSTYEYEIYRVDLDNWKIEVTIKSNGLQPKPKIKLLLGDKVPFTHPLFQRLLELRNEAQMQKMKPSSPKEYKLFTYNPLMFEWIFLGFDT